MNLLPNYEEEEEKKSRTKKNSKEGERY